MKKNIIILSLTSFCLIGGILGKVVALNESEVKHDTELIVVEKVVTVNDLEDVAEDVYIPWENLKEDIVNSFDNIDNLDVFKENFYFLSEIPMSKDIQKFIFDLCKEKGLDYVDVLALIGIESSYNPKLTHLNTNGTVDSGLFQVNSCNVSNFRKELGITGDILDPYNNARMGILELTKLTKQWESSKDNPEQHRIDVLSSYNKGFSGYKKNGKAVKYLEKHSKKKAEIIKIINNKSFI